jgi:peptidoglycan/LPS O-acetylase OafA/YrhL
MFSIPALTGIRAIAAGAVFFGHVLHAHLDEALPIFEYGWIGVNMFFALSGYLFYLLYVDALKDKTFSWKQYLSKRFIRIYPLTILVIMLSIATMPFSYGFMDIFSHLTLLHGYYPPYRFSINPPLWTLTVELSFYLIAPILIVSLYAIFQSWIERMSDPSASTTKLKIALATVIVWVIGIAFCNGITGIYQNLWFYFMGRWDGAAGTLTIFGRLDDFLAGMAIAAYAKLYPKGRIPGDALVAIGCAIIAIALIFTDAQGGANFVGKHKLSDFVFPSLAFGSGIIIMGLHRGGLIATFMSTKTMVLLGDISFGLYVLHYLSLPGHPKSALSFQAYLESIGIHFGISSIIVYALFSILAYVSFRYVEKPIGKFLSRHMLHT